MKLGNIFRLSGIGKILGKTGSSIGSGSSVDGDASLLNHPVTQHIAATYVKPTQVTGGLPYKAFEQ